MREKFDKFFWNPIKPKNRKILHTDEKSSTEKSYIIYQPLNENVEKKCKISLYYLEHIFLRTYHIMYSILENSRKS